VKMVWAVAVQSSGADTRPRREGGVRLRGRRRRKIGGGGKGGTVVTGCPFKRA
jgi:hypothetical protein